MRFGILQTGKLSDALGARFGDYPAMFERLYRAADASIETRAYPVVDGEFPTRPDECDAWLVTGSRFGVYDDQPWIAPLEAFLRRARAAGVPCIGICFGHQVMAEAFGGHAEKSAKGWGGGAQEYAVHASAPRWMADAPARITLHATHQDQVTAIPDDATCLASSSFCEFAMLAYGDPELPDAISIQPHPEFDAGLMRALIEGKRGGAVADAEADAALAGLGAPVDGALFVRWSLAWLARARENRAAA